MDKAEARRFIEKYVAGNYTAAEHQAFQEWLLSRPVAESENLLKEYTGLLQQNGNHLPADPRLLERIEKRINDQPLRARTTPLPGRRLFYAAAAVFALLIVAGLYLILTPEHPAAEISSAQEPKKDISPGGDNAVLTLADGSKITLNDAAEGTVARQGLTNIVKLNNGELTYTPAGDRVQPVSPALLYNTIETPRGGQYQLTLPDGTKVWLNAASSLRYPTSFTGPDRTVFLKGEAYFEVATSPASDLTIDKTARKPFHVQVNDMTVSVLGTHFNIMAYEDESHIRTTLLEGRVEISAADPTASSATLQPVQLYPGQLASLDKSAGTLNVVETDVGNAIAWKNGYFQFNRSDIYTIMRQVARWYDVEVDYEGTMPDEEFVGKISRYEPLSSVLRIFELSHIRFRIEGRKIIVMP